MKRYVVAKYEDEEHPFEVTEKHHATVMKGFYFELKIDNHFVKEKEMLLVKKKRFVRNLKDPVVVRGITKRAGMLYRFPDFFKK